jgi:hypothetical protein
MKIEIEHEQLTASEHRTPAAGGKRRNRTGAEAHLDDWSASGPGLMNPPPIGDEDSLRD